jgi:hypothetical protein
MNINKQMKDELFSLIEQKSPGAIPLYLTIRGSNAYGTNIPTSDIDFAGVFIQSHDDILGNKYVEQINDSTNDTVIYELRRFLELCGTNNPNILELLNTPSDCIIYKNDIFDSVLEHRDDFLTKICSGSFGGYAKTQIGKAKGQNKKQNWEKDKVSRKDLLDFCYVLDGEKSVPFKSSKFGSEYKPFINFLHKKYDVRKFGLVNIPHGKDLYALYYSDKTGARFSNGRIIRTKVLYKGLVKVGESVDGIDNYGISNQLRLSSIPKGEKSIATIVYNKDGYTKHCKDYREYQEWLQKRNLQRWVDVKSHDQKIDGKNMMHCYRLVQMAREIAEGKGVIVRRENAAELISIRRGELDLQTLIDFVESEIVQIDMLFKKSNLPDFVDIKLVNKLIIKIRKEIYGL